MTVNRDSVSEKIFNILKGYGYAVQSYDDDGKVVIDPRQATRFTVKEPNMIIRHGITDDNISFSAQRGENVEEIRRALKQLAQKNIYNFDFRLFNKQLTPKSEKIDIEQKQENDMGSATFESAETYVDKLDAYIAKLEAKPKLTKSEQMKLWTAKDYRNQHNKKNKQPAMEGFGVMHGTSKTSYQPLDNIKIVVRHKKPVNEEVRGSRSRNIHSIYIQRGDERFKMNENNLKAARAMARHLVQGGEVHDSVGIAISEMATEYKHLSEFVRYVRKANLVNEENEAYVSLAADSISQIRSTFERLSGTKTYANAVESLDDMTTAEILEDDVDLESKFVETHFDDKVANAMESIKKSMAKQTAYRNKITDAIQTESFAGLTDLLTETEVVDFATPHAKLSYQVARLGDAAQNETLKNHLYGISKKLDTGASLEQFEYSTIKSCLLSASEPKLASAPAVETVTETSAKFLNQFDIF